MLIVIAVHAGSGRRACMASTSAGPLPMWAAAGDTAASRIMPDDRTRTIAATGAHPHGLITHTVCGGWSRGQRFVLGCILPAAESSSWCGFLISGWVRGLGMDVRVRLGGYEVDEAERAELARGLQAILRDLDGVDGAALVAGGPVPAGAKSGGLVTWGALVVSLAS